MNFPYVLDIKTMLIRDWLLALEIILDYRAGLLWTLTYPLFALLTLEV